MKTLHLQDFLNPLGKSPRDGWIFKIVKDISIFSSLSLHQLLAEEYKNLDLFIYESSVVGLSIEDQEVVNKIAHFDGI